MNRTVLSGSAAVLLALTGLWLLLTPGPDRLSGNDRVFAQVQSPPLPSSPRQTGHQTAKAVASPVAPTGGATRASATPGSTAGSSPSGVPSGGLAPGDGPGADAAVQELLEQSSPRNLPPALERQLAHLAAQICLADVTGQGRQRWPEYFTQPGHSGYTHARIQAAIARATSPGHATATVLWAGTNPTGDTQVGLTTVIHLHQKPDHTWEPTR